ncbi:MAG: hypothetical protein C0391_00895 [Anaerolinea sp.]|nr:hypothetical protein [Anaerolinea sp.]
MNKRLSLIVILAAFSLASLISACGLPKKAAPTQPSIQPTDTVAPTVPGPTYTASPLPTMPPVPSPIITEIPAESATPEWIVAETEQPTEQSSGTSTAGGRPKASPIENSNCRVNPGSQTNIVGYFLVGMESDIFAKNPTEEWLLIANPHRDGEYCWVWIGRLTITGSLEDVEVIHPKLE